MNESNCVYLFFLSLCVGLPKSLAKPVGLNLKCFDLTTWGVLVSNEQFGGVVFNKYKK